MTEVYFVNHTHWDREWYFTTTDALVLSDQVFTEALDELETHPEANFTFDGQTSIIDDYIDIHPEARNRIKRLVQSKQLFIGPWYTQTDGIIPDAESMIRNLVIGIQEANQQYGEAMMVGYLPDTFGFTAQLPTILRQVGIDNFVFWRGTNYDHQLKSLYFNWRGLSNKTVIAANFPFGYFTGQITPESKRNLKEFVEQRYDPAVKFAVEHKDNQMILMPSGIDQMNIIHNEVQTIKDLNQISKYHTTISSYPEFINELRNNIKELPSYQGELRLPTYARVHRSIGSLRHRIKQENYELEQKILKRVEPLAVIGRKVGVKIGSGLIINLWKKLLECQPHDTLGGSITDNVYEDILARFKAANEMADGIENMIKKKIADFLKLKANEIIVFNTDAKEFSGRKQLKIISNSKKFSIDQMSEIKIEKERFYPAREHIMTMTARGKEFLSENAYYELIVSAKMVLPALGYKVFTIQPSKKELQISKKSNSSSQGTISVEGLKISFDKGKINITCNGKEIVNAITLVNCANDGDTYDFSPLPQDQETVLPFDKVIVTENTMKIVGSASLPFSLADYSSDNPHYQAMNYELELSFNSNKTIKGILTIDNTVESHRLRLRLQSGLKNCETIARIQLGYLKQQNELIPADWEKHYDEKPVNLYNFDKSVSLSNSEGHLTFLGKGQKEYQTENNDLLITLMSTTGQLGKPNLAWRPGRASGDTTNQGHPMIPTPLAQELGINKFKFDLEWSDEPFSETKNNELVNKSLDVSISYQKQQLNVFINRLDNKIWETEEKKTIPLSLSILSLNADLDVAAIYPSYTSEDSMIIRLQNLSKQNVNLPFNLINDQNVTVVNALEDKVTLVSIDPYDAISLKIKYLKNGG
ncbi:alpha-mannosidase [Xylocopilactobacillus apicola]|uniref:Alpha-mannosidase n=1 Tax=Xylocopilactobacillus apicola TaxID=2932184 RepID=A0AAU9D052_9LACO|nr:alpha-mannosidase [Xylocopilactobacillus apicola]BDR58071.1 alpha-mannosidase [Xylocopilactobacillus apicola]